MGKNETEPKEFLIDSQSPYFLHPLDSPGAIITTTKFNGKNYDLRQQAIRTALRAKNKVAFIDGTLINPTLKDDTNLAEANAWEMVNSIIMSWIMNVIDPKLHPSVAYVDLAQRMWENIRKRFSIPNVPRIHQLKSTIASCRQEGQEVMDFFSPLMSLWNELGNYTKVPSCTCGPAETMAKMLEQKKGHQFLMGLNDESFSTIRS